MRFTEETLFSSESMTGALTSKAIDLQTMFGYSIQNVWTGTPAGNIVVQKSNDKTTWFTVDTQAAGGAAGSAMVEKTDVTYRYVRVIWTPSASTGSLTTKFLAKG